MAKEIDGSSLVGGALTGATVVSGYELAFCLRASGPSPGYWGKAYPVKIDQEVKEIYSRDLLQW